MAIIFITKFMRARVKRLSQAIWVPLSSQGAGPQLTAMLQESYDCCVTIEQIRLRLKDGFCPFVLHISDGRNFKIPHPEFIMLGKGVVAILREDGLIQTLDALHITSIEDLPGEAVQR